MFASSSSGHNSLPVVVVVDKSRCRVRFNWWFFDVREEFNSSSRPILVVAVLRLPGRTPTRSCWCICEGSARQQQRRPIHIWREKIEDIRGWWLCSLLWRRCANRRRWKTLLLKHPDWFFVHKYVDWKTPSSAGQCRHRASSGFIIIMSPLLLAFFTALVSSSLAFSPPSSSSSSLSSTTTTRLNENFGFSFAEDQVENTPNIILGEANLKAWVNSVDPNNMLNRQVRDNNKIACKVYSICGYAVSEFGIFLYFGRQHKQIYNDDIIMC